MDGTEGDARERAWQSLLAQTAARHLARSWRDRSRTVARYSNQAAEIWLEAAKELENALEIPPDQVLLRRLLTAMRQEIVRDVRAEMLCITGTPRAATVEHGAAEP